MINITPEAIAIQVGPLPVFWYGIMYAVGLTATYLVVVRQARRAGLDAALVGDGIIVVAVAALIGGRAYHVIDQWALYQDDLLRIVLPPYTGLGVYGGLVTGAVAAWLLIRRLRQPFWSWADAIAPGLFTMQAIGRWGNFFNQELYGPPTTAPWGIAIDCAHRIAAYPCDQYPAATTGFHPLFLYESLSGFLGLLVLVVLADRWTGRRPGDLLAIFFAWYAAVRFGLEFLRSEIWTLGGIPTAQLMSIAFFVAAVGILIVRRRRSAAPAVAVGAAVDVPDDRPSSAADPPGQG